jgi:hypothetical protein
LRRPAADALSEERLHALAEELLAENVVQCWAVVRVLIREKKGSKGGDGQREGVEGTGGWVYRERIVGAIGRENAHLTHHLLHKVRDLWSILRRNGWIPTNFDLLDKFLVVSGFKRMAQCAHLVQQRPECPDVRFEVIPEKQEEN